MTDELTAEEMSDFQALKKRLSEMASVKKSGLGSFKLRSSGADTYLRASKAETPDEMYAILNEAGEHAEGAPASTDDEQMERFVKSLESHRARAHEVCALESVEITDEPHALQRRRLSQISGAHEAFSVLELLELIGLSIRVEGLNFFAMNLTMDLGQSVIQMEVAHKEWKHGGRKGRPVEMTFEDARKLVTAYDVIYSKEAVLAVAEKRPLKLIAVKASAMEKLGFRSQRGLDKALDRAHRVLGLRNIST